VIRTLLYTSLTATLGLAGACDRHDEGDDTHIGVEPEKTVPATKPLEPPPANVNELDYQRHMLQRQIEARTVLIEGQIDALEKRGDDKSKEAVAVLRAKRDQALAKLAELDKIEQDRWSLFERDVTTTWDQLERDVTEATR